MNRLIPRSISACAKLRLFSNGAKDTNTIKNKQVSDLPPLGWEKYRERERKLLWKNRLLAGAF
jgi:hypothetical protein